MTRSLKLVLDDYDTPEFVAFLAGHRPAAFEFVVTPNVDHVIRYCDEPSFRELYDQAAFILNDSRLLRRILSLSRGLRPRVCPGSDLTAGLFSVIQPDDRIVLVGATAAMAEQLRALYGLRNLQHHDPPMGFIRDTVAVERAAEFVEAHSPFRFCFLAVGSPQQERFAAELMRRGRAQGVALCIGASINFLTGSERRAPRWMQSLSLEWLYRLLQSPRRLGSRYLVRGPRILRLLPRLDIQLRRIRDAGA